MSVRIAVSDPLPVFRRGLMAMLSEAGLDSEAAEDIMAWLRNKQRRVILLTLTSPEDWALLARVRDSRADVIVVAVLDDATIESHARALTEGAVSAVPRDAPPEFLREVVEAAVRGTSLVPTQVIRVLASRQMAPSSAVEHASPQEVEWLRQLAGGATVVQIAERAGYSERAMFRLLRDLYRKMSVKNRVEAIMQARDRGWL